ncbi:hypothetical protein ABK040_005943 [Willaertia magna]
MFQYISGKEPLPSRMIFWHDTFLEHEKANHQDIIRNHPFNYRLELFLMDGGNTVNYEGIENIERKQNLKEEEIPFKQTIKTLLEQCQEFQDKSTFYILKNINSANLISYLQNLLIKDPSLHIYCHTLGQHSDNTTSNQMGIYPIFQKNSLNNFEHVLRLRIDKDTSLELGLQKNEKSRLKKTNHNSIGFDINNFITINYELPFKSKKVYDRVYWSLKNTFGIYCFLAIYSEKENCWMKLNDLEKELKKEDVEINEIKGSDVFTVRTLSEKDIFLPKVSIDLNQVVNNKMKESIKEEEIKVDEDLSTLMDKIYLKEVTEEKQKEKERYDTVKSIIDCIGLLSGGLGSLLKINTKQSSSSDEDIEGSLLSLHPLLFENSILQSNVTFEKVKNTVVIKVEGILPPVWIEKVFMEHWKGLNRNNNNCYQALLVVGNEDAMVSWKKFNHTYCISGENDYLYLLFPKIEKNEKVITPNWLVQLLNQQDELS